MLCTNKYSVSSVVTSIWRYLVIMSTNAEIFHTVVFINKYNSQCFYFLVPDAVSSPLQDGEHAEENMALSDEAREEEMHPAGDLPDRLQDGGDQGEERTEEEVPTGTSPPQVPPKHVSQLSSGEGGWFRITIKLCAKLTYILTYCLSDSGPMSLPTHLPNSYLPPKEPPPRAPELMVSMTLPLRGPLGNPSGSPHLGNMIHPPMPPSCIMEELQRAFASKNRQER